MPKNLDDVKQERLTRHQRYFNKIVVLIVLVLAGLVLWTLHTNYKARVEHASIAQREIQELRARNEIFPAVDKMSKLSNKDFWYIWPVINQKIKTYEAPFYYEFAKRFWANGDRNKAIFWTLLGRYRLNYDAHRCVDESARDWKNYFDKILSDDAITNSLNDNVALLEISLKDVLAWDIDSIIASDPSYICNYTVLPSTQMAAIVPKQDWIQIHTYLRQTTAGFIFNKEKETP